MPNNKEAGPLQLHPEHNGDSDPHPHEPCQTLSYILSPFSQPLQLLSFALAIAALTSLMCRKRTATLASTPKPRPSPRVSDTSTAASNRNSTTSTSTTTTAASFSSDSLRDSLRDLAILYPFPELSAATNNLLTPRCSLRGSPAIVLHRRLRADPASIPSRLATFCRSQHTSIARLLGASVPGDGRIYLVYEQIPGATLSACLRSPHNPGFTTLSTWQSRIQIAADLAQGLEYIHHHSGGQRSNVHNRIKSSGVIVTEPGFRAKICDFGAVELSGELIETEAAGGVRIEGARGYMAPEVLAGERVSQRSDVYAFGVLMLELLSGAEPVRYRFVDKRLEMVAVVETAREAYGAEGEEVVDEERRGRVRRWMDRRLKDSFPLEVVEKLMRVVLRCVEAEAGRRPDMVWVAGKVSRLFLDSVAWEQMVGTVPEFSVSLAPR